MKKDSLASPGASIKHAAVLNHAAGLTEAERLW